MSDDDLGAFRGLINGILISLVIWALIGAAIAFAGDDHHNDGDVTVNGGDVNVNGGDVSLDVGDVNNAVGFHDDSLALGLGRSSFDVDISDCRESVAWDTVIGGRQTVRLNPWCAAEAYDRMGLYRMAGYMRCDIAEIRKHFTSIDDCVAENTISAVPPSVALVNAVEDKFDEHDEREAEHEKELQMLQAFNAELIERVEQLEQRASRPRPAAPAPTIVQQYGLTEEQRAEIANVLSKGEK